MTPPDTGQHVGLVPYELRPKGRLADIPLDALRWPLGTQPIGETVADLGPDDHILVHPNTSLHFARWGKLRCKTSLLIAEPDAIHGKHLKILHLSHRRFHRILTRSPFALSRFSNARLFVTGDTFISGPEESPVETTKMVSVIASTKRNQEGHLLRHALIDFIRRNDFDVDVLGRGYAPFENKADGLAPYLYSVIIENVQEPAMFTEKLIDACLCRTVPIYWGAPDIDRWFNADGLIACDTLEDLQTALGQISKEDAARRQTAMEENRLLALEYAKTDRRAAQLLLSDEAESPPFE